MVTVENVGGVIEKSLYTVRNISHTFVRGKENMFVRFVRSQNRSHIPN